MDIRLKTCLILQRGNRYLVGRIIGTRDIKWSIYRSDAFRTRDIEAAEALRKKFGGDLLLYNPVVNQVKEFHLERGVG